MVTTMFQFRIITRVALFCFTGFLSACAVVDGSYAPRTDNVTREVGDQRDRATLLNIIRASRFDTLNFTALAKYTAGGSLQLTSNLLTRSFAAGAVLPGDMFGPNNAVGMVTNSFDLGSLENSAFYNGLLSTIDATTINLLLSSGLDRELVMHAVIASVEFKTKDGQKYRVYNEPINDESSKKGTNECESIFENQTIKSEYWFYTVIDRSGVPGKKNTYCSYQKFRYLLRFALQHGLTTRLVSSPPSEVKKSDSGKDIASSLPKANLCFDSSLAQTITDTVGGAPQCSDLKNNLPFVINFNARSPITTATPYFRSPYGVFQYLGGILRKPEAKEAARTVQDDHPALLFDFTTSVGDCFVEAQGIYIPAGDRSQMAKQMMAILNALVALNVKPSALPITPSVQVTPGL